jgi:multiple sugar transport system substrate-binding protein
MKKIVLLLIALVILGGAVYAAGKDDAGGGTGKPVTITYWQYFYQTKVELMDELIADFEAKNPGIKVEHVHFPYENYNQKVASSVPVGTGPDVLNLFYGWLPMYVKGGYLQPLPASEFGADYFKNNFYSFVEESVKFNNQYYSVPTAVRTLALVWNKKLFREAGLDPEKPPKTLDELVEYAKKLTKYDAQGNIIISGFGLLPAGQGHSWIREVLIRQFGGVPYSSDGRKVTYNSTPAGEAALKWYTDRSIVDKVGAPGFTPDDGVAFRNNLIAMNIEGSFRIATFQAASELEWGAAELPVHNGIKSNYASFWTNSIAEGVTGDKLAASIKFLKYLASPEVQAKWLEKIGELPANPKLAAQQNNLPYVSPFLKGLEYAHATIFVDEKGQREIVTGMVDQVILNKTAPKTVIEEAAKQEQKIIDDFWK